MFAFKPKEVIIGAFPTIGLQSHPQLSLARVHRIIGTQNMHIWVGAVVKLATEPFQYAIVLAITWHNEHDCRLTLLGVDPKCEPQMPLNVLDSVGDSDFSAHLIDDVWFTNAVCFAPTLLKLIKAAITLNITTFVFVFLSSFHFKISFTHLSKHTTVLACAGTL